MKAREEQLKAILNKRLSEVKKETEAAKQAALEDLRTSLNAEHREEMEKLRSQSAPTSVEVQNGSGSPEAAEAPQSQPEEGRMTFEEFMTKITEPQVQRMISESESMKSLISRSIRKRVDKEKEIWEKELAQGQPDASADEINQQVREIEQRFATEKETLIRQKDEELNAEREAMLKQHNDELEAAKQTWLEEQQKKVADEVAKAKASMEKMVAMKHNMLLKQSQGHLAKINIVKQAAEETPDEPVKKVWDIAKSAKVPAETPKPAAVTAAAPKATLAPAAAPASKPTEDAVKVESQPAIEKNEKAPPAPEASSQQPEAGDEAPQQGNPPAAAQAVQSRSTGLPQPASQLPRGNFSGRGRGNVQGGRGTAIPRPGSALGNHTGQSTRGRGGSRGGHNPSSPSRGGGLNPAAQQFTPQNKRPREEGEDTGNQGKRIRGGGAGS